MLSLDENVIVGRWKQEKLCAVGGPCEILSYNENIKESVDYRGRAGIMLNCGFYYCYYCICDLSGSN